jgi:hypothetical protein
MVKPSSIFKSRSAPKKIQTKFIDEQNKEIMLDWIVKPLSPRLMVQNYKYFAALEKMDTNEKGTELTEDEQIETLEKLAPLIDVVLPYCCVEPKIVMEGETNDKQINIDDLSVETLMSLFSGIFESSGLAKKGEEQRKNLGNPPSQKPSQVSA